MRSKVEPYFHFINKKCNFMKNSLCLTTSIGCILSIKVKFSWQDEIIFPLVSLLWIYLQVFEFSNFGFWPLFCSFAKPYPRSYKKRVFQYKFCIDQSIPAITVTMWLRSTNESTLYVHRSARFNCYVKSKVKWTWNWTLRPRTAVLLVVLRPIFCI